MSKFYDFRKDNNDFFVSGENIKISRDVREYLKNYFKATYNPQTTEWKVNAANVRVVGKQQPERVFKDVLSNYIKADISINEITLKKKDAIANSDVKLVEELNRQIAFLEIGRSKGVDIGSKKQWLSTMEQKLIAATENVAKASNATEMRDAVAKETEARTSFENAKASVARSENAANILKDLGYLIPNKRKEEAYYTASNDHARVLIGNYSADNQILAAKSATIQENYENFKKQQEINKKLQDTANNLNQENPKKQEVVAEKKESVSSKEDSTDSSSNKKLRKPQ